MNLEFNDFRSADAVRYTLDDFNSTDRAMTICLELARVASRTDLPILILGESGTGKTLLARAIHNSSARAKRPFVAFNAAALSDTLVDSQLFGHEKGAFTGAGQRVKGKFELATLGTLFIDEIADMSAVAQAKILRAVEYGEFERLGSERLQVADVRLISATHFPLRRFIGTDQFRKDLFYRISGITITIPPLRERPSDLPVLITSELATASRKQRKSIVGLDKRAAELLFSYHWPGNLRELQKVIHAAVAMMPGDVISPDVLVLEARDASHVSDALGTGQRPGGSNGDLRALNAEFRTPGGEQDLRLKTLEQRHIRGVLERMGGNKRRAAKALGLSRSTLDRKLSS